MRLLLAAFLLLPAAARAEGMPQLDFANPLTTSQVVWGAIIFAVLYVLASRFALPKVAAVLEERATHIAPTWRRAGAKHKADAAVAELTAATARRAPRPRRRSMPRWSRPRRRRRSRRWS